MWDWMGGSNGVFW